MTTLDVHLLPMLTDNYAYLLRDVATGATAVVDPSEAAPAIDALDVRGWPLAFVINTHHHWDHVGGNAGLKQRYGAKLAAPSYDEHRLKGIDVPLTDGEPFALGESVARVLHIPGHTTGHVALYFAEAGALFCGDTLFSLGCGRMFEGTPEQMHASLRKLAALPPETRVYCGHEYTEANARFALTVEPGNAALQARAAEVRRLRAEGRPSVPSRLGDEVAANPFLRAPDAAAFARIRSAKDHFKG